MANIDVGSLVVQFAGDLTKYNQAAAQFTSSQQQLEAKVKQFGAAATAFDAHAKAAQSAISPVKSLTDAVQGVVQQSNDLKTASQGVASTLNTAKTSMQNYEQATQQATGGVKSLVSGITNFASSTLKAIPSAVQFGKNIAEFVVYTKEATLVVAGYIQSIFAQNAAMEQTKIAFTGILKSGTAAEDLLKTLESFAAKTPFEFPELATDARLLLAMGFNARDIIPWLTAVGDTVSGLGAGNEVMQRIIYSMGQMKSMGRVTGEEMRELAIAGVPAWNWLAKAIGTDVPTAMKMAQSGAIDVNVALDALKTGMENSFGGQMQNQAQTFNGLITTLKDNIGNAWRAIVGPAFDKVKVSLKWLVDTLDPSKIKPFAEYIGKTLGQYIEKAASWFEKLYKWVKLFLDRVQNNGALKKLSDIFLQIKNIITTVFIDNFKKLADAFTGVNKNGDKASSSATKVADAIKKVADAISNGLGFIQNLIGLLSDSSIKGDLLRDALLGIAAGIAAIKIINFLGNIATLTTNMINLALSTDGATASLGALAVVKSLSSIGNLISTLPTAIGLFWLWAGSAWGVAAGMIATAWPVIAIVGGVALLTVGILLLVQHWGAVVAFLQNVWGACVSWVLGTLSNIKNFFVSVWTNVSSFFIGIWNNVVSFFVSVWTNISNFVVGVWTNISNFATSLWNNVTGAIMGAVNAVVSWVHQRFVDFYNAVIGPLLPMINWFGSVFTAIWLIISTIITKVVAWIGTKLAQAWAIVVGVFTTVRDFLGNVFSTIYNTVASWITRAVLWISAKFNEAKLIIQTVLGIIHDFVAMIFQKIYDAVVKPILNILAKVKEIFANIYNAVAEKVMLAFNKVTEVFNNIKDAVSNKMSEIFNTLSDWWNRAVGFVTDAAQRIWKALTDKFTDLKNAVGNIFKDVINGIIKALNWGIGALRNFLNMIADGLNNVMGALGISGHNVAHVDSWLKDIPLLAKGTNSFQGGAAIVGEKGPELVFLPQKTQVLSADVTQRVAQQPGTLSRYSGGFDPGAIIGNVFSSIGTGVHNLVDLAGNFFSLFKIPDLSMGAGVLGDIAGGLLSSIKNSIGDWLTGNKPSAANLPMAKVGDFTLPPGGGFHEMLWYGIHQGMDFQFPQGSVLQEIIGGKVNTAGWFPWGGEIDVGLSNGLTERYEHLSALWAKVGDVVKRGDILGLTGGGTPESGLGYWSNGPHLHVQYDTGSYQTGIDPLRVWQQYGLFSPFSFGNGGVIGERVMGVGMSSGRSYQFGENGPETVVPGVGGSGSETNDLLRAILAALHNGKPLSRYEVGQALGSLIAEVIT